MLAKIYSYALSGLEAYPTTIEVDVSRGLPATLIVGLPDNAVKESKERVRAAIKNSGYKFPAHRITINLTPADIKKEGPSFDLAIALGILAATEQIPASSLNQFIILGALSLDGSIHAIQGALPIAMAFPPNQFQGIILPKMNAAEAAIVNHIKAYPVTTLHEAIHFLKEQNSIKPYFLDINSVFQQPLSYDIDFADVKGQLSIKRGLEVAATGGHNALLIGSPGSGKTMLAKRLPTILPDMTLSEALETTQIHSVMGLVNPQIGLITTRPFRSPHHTSSDVSLVGGGSNPRPGEVSLAHNGVLFLDEFPEFHRDVLEALRQPLEDHHVTISRATKTIKFPSRFMMICAMNPCPCGWFSDPKKTCHCSQNQIQRYMAKISGPLLDRIDIHLEVPSLKFQEFILEKPRESSAEVKKRTVAGRQIQQKRFFNTNIHCNAQMNQRQIKQFCGLTQESQDLLKMAIDELGLSARAHDKILRVARTIADLENSIPIKTEHVAEAIQYRSLDRNFFG